MSVNSGSPLAREWAREEIDKLNRLERADIVNDERKTMYKVVMMYDDDSLALLKWTEAEVLSFLARKESTIGKIIFVEELS